MSISLTVEDLRQLTRAQQSALSPLQSRQPAEWAHSVVTDLASAIGADSGVFMVMPPKSEAPLVGVLNAEAETLRSYEEYYSQRELLQPAPGPAVQYLPDAVDRKTLESSEIYNDFWKPTHQFDNLALTAPLPGGGSLAVFFQKATRRGPRFGERGKSLLQLMGPALMSGVQTYADWSAGQGKLLRFLDKVGDGLLLCGTDGRPRHANAALTRLLGADPGARRIREAAEEMARRLAPMVRGAGPNGPIEQDVVAAVPMRVVTDRAAYRLRGTCLDAEAAGGPGVLITVKPEGIQLPSAASLGERFDLTPRQAEVALLLAQRKTNEEVAERLSISPHTARRHTETVFLKLGVSSRLDVRGVVIG